MSNKKGKADDIDKFVSSRLKMRRVLLGMNQQDLSNAIGVSIQQIQKYEKAVNRISSGKLYSLAKFLNVPVSYFYNPIDSELSISSSFGEEPKQYNADNNHIPEKEIISLIKVFKEIKSPQVRKKVIELLRTLSNDKD